MGEKPENKAMLRISIPRSPGRKQKADKKKKKL